MSDPFKIKGPALISFSGGRTSAYMLWRIVQAHGGTLPADVKVEFNNTGYAQMFKAVQDQHVFDFGDQDEIVDCFCGSTE